ncbi:MAG: ribosome assembly factor SBDS [Candidatus Aenigmarchaeota archaeon]|nr:ribosome assembly factor SBDS [Candidatus Aenigmarchaeota archaeon]
MVSVDKAVIARMHRNGKDFEVLVDPDLALEFRKGREMGIERVLAIQEVFRDSKKGERVSSNELKAAFGTDSILKVSEEIIRHGEVQLTTEQRRKMIEEKRRQIADIISRQGIDPRTNLPHPPLRILNAMEQIHITIDPFKPAEQQVKDILDKIQPILPIRFETVEIAVRIPAQYAGKASFYMKRLGMKKEEWQPQYWYCVAEIPAGMQGEIYSKLNELAAGQAEVKVMSKK